MKANRFIFLILTLFSISLSADQAAYIDKKSADKANNLLSNHNVVREFCAPCGDNRSKLVDVKTLETKHTNYKNFYQVFLNDDGVDLAYLYFKSPEGWKNVAIAIDFPVQSVPEFLDLNLELELSKEVDLYSISSIERSAKACLSDALTTYSQANCKIKELKNWDGLLNQSYKKLMNNKKDLSKENLRNAQKAWIKYRDLEYLNIESLLEQMQGTMWYLVELSKKTELTRQRAIELTDQFKTLTKNCGLPTWDFCGRLKL